MTEPLTPERARLRAALVAALDTAHYTHPCPETGRPYWLGCVHADGRVGPCHSERRADAVLTVLDAEIAATEEKASTTVPTATPDFFQPEHTYQRRRWHFQCLAVAPNPFNGEVRAVGYLFRPGEPATATALDPDDWALGEWTELTRDGA